MKRGRATSPKSIDTQRSSIYRIYNNACAWCGRGVELEVHHLKIKGMGGRHNEWMELADSLENLVLLCRTCHSAAHGEAYFSLDGHNCGICVARWACTHCQVEMAAGESAEGFGFGDLFGAVAELPRRKE